ncbi:hypothetical protein [Sphingopyxis sp. NJF-3]
MQPLDLIGAAPWQRVIFTTYALSLSFFEAVVLDRLVRGGGRNALILADPEGIRAALSEQGARRAGRDYELEPVASTTGVFHPKLTLLFGEGDAHMLISSGNLTFGGWGMNLETVDHLHPSFAADAFDDAADLFESLAIADTIRTGVADQFELTAAQLRLAARGAPRNGTYRLLHSVGGSIAEQLAQFADDLGGATRVTIVSPYFDKTGSAVSRLSALLKCEDVRLHVHPEPKGAVRGTMGTNWPEALSARAVCVDAPFDDGSRALHAKCIEVLCRRGRLLVAGSANATNAALFAGNVEASLVRMQRDVTTGWKVEAAVKPAAYPLAETEDTDDGESRKGILRAMLEGDRVVGKVIVPRLQGKATLSVATTAGYNDLGIIDIDGAGRFEAAAPDLEMQSWGGGRMVLRIEQNDNVAEGFMSIAAAAKIIQKAGAMAPRLLAMLSGTETPEDVAAILTWFKEDPVRIVSAMPRGGQGDGKAEHEPIWVSIEQLRAVGEFHASGPASSSTSEPAWQRALWLVRSAFTEPRGPWKSGTGEDDQAEDEEDAEGEDERLKRLQREDNAKHRAMNALDDLLEEMLAERHKGIHAASAFALAHYLADRVRPAPSVVFGWLARILGAFVHNGLPMDAPIATAGVLLRASDGLDRAAERARTFLLRSGVDPVEFAPDDQAIPGFVEILSPSWNAEQFMGKVRATRTPGEEVRAYLDAAENGEPLPSFPILQNSPYWQQLSSAFANSETRSRFHIVEEPRKSCPKCNLVLPTGRYQDLRLMGVTHHCGIILCREV